MAAGTLTVLERSIRCRAKGVGRRSRFVALTLLAALGCAGPARAEPAVVTGTGKVIDLIIMRPLGLGELVFGFLCFAPAALFAGKSVAEPWEHFVIVPFESTFKRPLGEFEEEF